MPKCLRVPLTELRPGPRQLDDSMARYVSRVHRLGPGDAFLAFDPEQGVEADAVIQGTPDGGLGCEISAVRVSAARPTRSVVLLQAVGKGDKPEQIVRAATALGATRVVLFRSERSVALADSASRPARLRAVALDAARQSGRGDLPELLGPVEFVAALGELNGLGLVFEPLANVSLATELSDVGDRAITLLIGPEGGLTQAEQAAALRANFTPVRLGRFVLRTELAAAAALGAVAALDSAR